MKIGIDIMGGDYAPDATISGAILASQELPKDVTIVLIGDEKQIESVLEKRGLSSSRFEIIPTTVVIGMGEHLT